MGGSTCQVEPSESVQTRRRLQPCNNIDTFPARLYHDHPTSRQPHHIEHASTFWQHGRATLLIPSTPTSTPEITQSWLVVVKVRADSASRHRDRGKLTRPPGKTGGKTGGKGDSHVKTTKSHSAKAGLQVSSCPKQRVMAQPPPRAFAFAFSTQERRADSTPQF